MRRITFLLCLSATALCSIAGLLPAQETNNVAPNNIARKPATDIPAPTPNTSNTSTTSATGTPATSKTVDIEGTSQWLDTGIALQPQDQVTFTATGTLKLPDTQKGKQTTPGATLTPAGANRGFRDMLKSYPVNGSGQGALIGRIGSTDTAQAFLIGPSLKWTAPIKGNLFLGINKAGSDAPTGTFHVTIDVAARTATIVPINYTLPEVTVTMVDRVPRRIVDAQGNAGDNTNFMIVGTEKQIIAALKAAGWLEVDHSKGDAITAGIMAVLNKQAYLTIPMSELMLFGRIQDHGMAHAEPISVVSQRHHFRIWKAPFQAGTTEVWVGAGTHDIGFDRDQRNNGVTHKIDPDVDLERDFIGMSMQESGLVAKLAYITPSKPSKEAVTATGAIFHSDGRVLVIYLIPEASSTTTSPTASTPPANAAQEKNTPSIFDGVN